MAKTRLFGESISPGVIKQLERRAEVLSRGVRNSNDLRYLNEKTSWVRMISGVDTQNAENNFTSQEAKNFILSGGEVKWDGKRFVRRQGFNTGDNQEERGRYNYNKDLGIRPEAGITAFSIKHIGTHGALREASLTFNVWTRDDLEKAQNLFLRPGVSLIVEWGNAIYLQDNQVKDTLDLNKTSDYFQRNSKKYISDILEKNKVNNSFNYEAFLGTVTNFTWSFRSDGGYDCSIVAITPGAILESLTILKSSKQAISQAGGVPIKGKLNNIDLDESKTYLHYVNSLLISFLGTNKSIEGTATKNRTTTQANPDFNILKEQIEGNLVNLLSNQNLPDSSLFYSVRYVLGEQKNAIFINLNTFCALLNIAFSFQSPNGDSLTSFFVQTKDSDFLLPSYCTGPNHFSFNPHYCFLPKKVFLQNNVQGEVSDISLGALHDDVIGNEPNKTKILGIYVNLTEIIKDLDEIYNNLSEPEKLNVFDFVKKVINKINSYLGGINSFDLTFNEDLQSWTIVDRNCIFPPKEADEENFKVERIDVAGLKSTISNLSLQTEITPSLSSQIAISAAASKQTIDNNTNLPLLDWNSKIVDRFSGKENIEVKEKENKIETNSSVNVDNTDTEKTGYNYASLGLGMDSPPFTATSEIREVQSLNQTQDIQEDLDQPFTSFTTDVQNLYSSLQNTKKGEPETTGRTLKEGGKEKLGFFYTQQKNSDQESILTKDVFKKLRSEALVRLKFSIYGDSTVQGVIGNSGLIPIVLEMTLDGIGGLKIGQIFKLGDIEKPSNILPEIYNQYGFAIVGVDSVVENSKWLTTIRGLTFRLEKRGIPATGKLS